MPTTVAGSLTMRSCWQFCQASAPMSLMPDCHRHTLRTQSGTGYSKAWHTPLSLRIAVSPCHHRNNSMVALSIRFRWPFMSMNPEEIVPEGAFAGNPRLRHARSSNRSNFATLRETLIVTHCVALHCIWPPPRLTQIGKEAFLNCVMLQEAVIPTELSDIGNRAFCGCEQLQRFTPLDWGDIEQWVQRQSTMLSSCVTNLKNPGGWSSSPLMGPIRTPLMKSYAKSTSNIKLVHERFKVGALASVFRKHPWP